MNRDILMETVIDAERSHELEKTRAAMCVFSPEQIAGPYFRNDRLHRYDITEGAEGVPMELILSIVNVKTCEPIEGLLVDIWHCNAQGRYSGWSEVDPDKEALSGEIGSIPRTDEDSYLRGCGFTNVLGNCSFRSVFPGFYAGRSIHVHVAVRKLDEHNNDRHVAYVGQLYVPESISSHISELPGYAGRKITRLTNEQDEIYSEMHGFGTLMDMEWIYRGTAQERLLGTVVIGVDPDALSAHITPEDFYKDTV
jgi:protocatechuate 3,4-dioxygenase beta subunit